MGCSQTFGAQGFQRPDVIRVCLHKGNSKYKRWIRTQLSPQPPAPPPQPLALVCAPSGLCLPDPRARGGFCCAFAEADPDHTRDPAACFFSPLELNLGASLPVSRESPANARGDSSQDWRLEAFSFIAPTEDLSRLLNLGRASEAVQGACVLKIPAPVWGGGCPRGPPQAPSAPS